MEIRVIRLQRGETETPIAVDVQTYSKEVERWHNKSIIIHNNNK